MVVICDMSELEQKYSDFISTLSHELRTPLTSIRGFADTLLVSGDKLTPEQKRKFLEIIKTQSERLIKMVENVLAVSKLESQSGLFVFKPTNVLPIIEQAVNIVKFQYPKHTIKVKYLQESKVHSVIYVDSDKYQQVMVNLLENAAKYSNEGTLIIVEVVISNNDLLVRVIDEGIGIEQIYLDKIFEKFSRIDSPLTRRTQGSGLGLYITKSLVEKMNGSISVISSEKGSTFEIKFPLLNTEVQAQRKLKES